MHVYATAGQVNIDRNVPYFTLEVYVHLFRSTLHYSGGFCPLSVKSTYRKHLQFLELTLDESECVTSGSISLFLIVCVHFVWVKSVHFVYFLEATGYHLLD